MRVLLAILILTVAWPSDSHGQWRKGFDPSSLWKEGGYVLMLRHEEAPGFGDPDNFKIDDCATQRNLSDRGRGNARFTGQVLRGTGLTADNTVVLTSQWCRCRETAVLLGLGQPKDFDGLNSFFEMSETREPNLGKIRALFSRLPTDGPLVIMVTHQVTISAITGDGLASGEGRILKLNGTGRPQQVSEFRVRRPDDVGTCAASRPRQ